ncbi:MAG: tetratricopeptide repeat protein [Candidatus Omnitrophota bacterium]
MNRKILSLSIALIIVLGIAAYAGSLGGKFLLDDELLIKNNIFIIHRAGPGIFFTTDIMAGVGMVSAFYRPLQMITYASDHAVWNLNATGYHITSMLLHILVALCIYRMLSILLSDNKLSFLASALFVVHPIHTEAVSYISGRADPLSCLFMLLCFIIYIKEINRDKISLPGYILIPLTYALALLSKETSVILPLLLLFYHFVFKRKIKVLPFVLLLGVFTVYLFIRLIYLRLVLVPMQAGFDTMPGRIPGFFAAMLTYIKLLFLPFPLHMEYRAGLFAFTNPRVIAGIILTFIIIAFAWIKRKNKIILFSIGWFFLGILPVSNLYKISAYMAEHFLYLPSIGFFMLIAYALTGISNNKKYSAAGTVLIIALLSFYLTAAIKQNDYWKTPFAFYDRTLKLVPESESAYYGRGILYDKIGKYDQAIADYDMAILIKPDYTDAYNNRGIVYDKKGEYDKAMADYKKAIRINPDYAPARNNLKNTYEKIDRNKSVAPHP